MISVVSTSPRRDRLRSLRPRRGTQKHNSSGTATHSEQRGQTSGLFFGLTELFQGQAPFNYLNGGVLPLGAHKAGTSTDDYLQQSFAGMSPCLEDTVVLILGDDDDDLLLDSVSRVRLVQFQKDTEEPMGITLKVGLVSSSAFLLFSSLGNRGGPLLRGEDNARRDDTQTG